MVGRRVAKAAMTEVYNTEIGNKKKLWTNLIKGACMVRVFVLGYNTIGAWPG